MAGLGWQYLKPLVSFNILIHVTTQHYVPSDSKYITLQMNIFEKEFTLNLMKLLDLTISLYAR